MAEFIKLTPDTLQQLRTVDPMLISYNVEMTEVTGGTFWKAYTDAQIDGTEQVPPPDFSKGIAAMHQWYDPIDTTNPRLIRLARELGQCWVRVSGTWATRTYYDFDGTGMPEGYNNHLRKEQWISLCNFVKAVNGKLKISVANCDGLHSHDEPWHPEQADKIFALSKELGCPIEAVEFVNEPNMLTTTGFPKGYTAADFRRDQDIFHKWIREHYPECAIVGPSDTDPNAMSVDADGNPHPWGNGGASAGIAAALAFCDTAALMDGCKEKVDIFSYHYYNGVSERMAAMAPGAFTPYEQCMSEEYLGMAGLCARSFVSYRDKYAKVPGGQMWVTESGDAGAGGHTWASTYAEVIRTLNEIGTFAIVTDGVIFHNTLASSDYGWLKHGTFAPRPSYFAVLLWKKLMGNTVYASGEEIRPGAHVFCHDRADGKEGKAYLVINNSWTETTTVALPKTAQVYALTGTTGMRSRTMSLNGRDLVLGENDELPELTGVTMEGTVEIAPGGCTFIVL